METLDHQPAESSPEASDFGKLLDRILENDIPLEIETTVTFEQTESDLQERADRAVGGTAESTKVLLTDREYKSVSEQAEAADP